MTPTLRRILFALLFLVTGSALTLLVQHLIARSHPAGSAAAQHAAMLSQMDSALGLTSAQRDSVHAIFARHQLRVDSGWRAINQGLRATMDSVHVEILQILNPAQIATFHELMRRHRGAFEH